MLQAPKINVLQMLVTRPLIWKSSCIMVNTFKIYLSKIYISTIKCNIVKTHDSESRGQEEASRTRRMSVLLQVTPL